jgi:imidazole glycerol-phosphate synthase subunit HisH
VGSSAEADIRAAERIILPGVGAFDAAMDKLEASGRIPLLRERAFGDRIPFLGICLGMQLLAKGSEEGQRPGLGWIDAQVVKFRREQAATPIRVPHMGWNTVRPRPGHPLFVGLEHKARFYFVHSFHAVCAPESVLCATDYGYEFASGLVRDNVCGVQFHPEKSHKYGFALLKNFVEM